jgi:hypothetical protein
MQGREYAPMREDAGIKKCATFDEPCKEQVHRSYGLNFEGCSSVVPRTCCHNLEGALRVRYMSEKGPYDKQLIRDIIENFKNFLNKLTKPKWPNLTREQWLKHLPPRRRKAMEEASEVLVALSAMGNAFVKVESYSGKDPDTFKARMITARMDEFQNEYGTYFYNLSKWLFELLKETNLKYDGGFSAELLGKLAEEMDCLGTLYELDVSNWDGCIEMIWYELELWLIDEFAPVRPENDFYRKYWYGVRGSGYGLSYFMSHSRRSGDLWTSPFNSLINLAILLYLFGDAILAVAKGDDSYLGAKINLSVEFITEFYKRIAMVVEVKKPHINELGYCSGLFWKTDSGRKWGINPFKVLQKFGYDLNHNSPNKMPGLMKGTMLSMLNISSHVPIVSELFSHWLEQCDTTRAIFTNETCFRNEGEEITPLCLSAYEQLSWNTGQSVQALLELTESLCKINFSSLPVVVDSVTFKNGFSSFFGGRGESTFIPQGSDMWNLKTLWAFLLALYVDMLDGGFNWLLWATINEEIFLQTCTFHLDFLGLGIWFRWIFATFEYGLYGGGWHRLEPVVMHMSIGYFKVPYFTAIFLHVLHNFLAYTQWRYVIWSERIRLISEERTINQPKTVLREQLRPSSKT